MEFPFHMCAPTAVATDVKMVVNVFFLLLPPKKDKEI